MRYLNNHYSTHGLEHLLEVAKYYEAQKSQKALLQEVMEGQKNGLDPETIRKIVLSRSERSQAAAHIRANEPKHPDDEKCASSDLEGSSDIEDDEQSQQGVLQAFGSGIGAGLFQSSACKFSVDLPSLRRMNSELVEAMKNVSPSCPSFSYSVDSSAADRTRAILRSALFPPAFTLRCEQPSYSYHSDDL